MNESRDRSRAGIRAISVAAARALLVADERSLRRAVGTYLHEVGFQVLEVSGGLEALARLRRGSVDIAVIDVKLPDLGGLELVRRARRESTIPIILLNASAPPGSRIAGLEAGADDFIAGPLSLAELVARMRAQLRRARGFATTELLRSGPVEVDLATGRCIRNGREVELTRLEFDLLGTLLRYPGRVHSREQLLELIWGERRVRPKAVDVHVAALRRKLGPAVLIATQRGVGYRHDPVGDAAAGGC
jgi:DNA-binding response OmpR family regulator